MAIMEKLRRLFGAQPQPKACVPPPAKPDTAVLALRGEALAAAMLTDPGFIEKHERADAASKAAGSVDGRHFTAYVPEVKALKKAKDYDAAAGLLLRLVDAVEAEARFARGAWHAVPWFHGELAAIYRRIGRRDLEATALRRYVLLCSAVQQEPPAKMVEALALAQSAEVEEARQRAGR